LSKLSIGILIDDWQVAAWSYKMLEMLQNSDYAQIRLVVKRGAEHKPVKPSMAYGLYKLYRRLDRKFFPTPQNAFARKDLRDFLSDDVPVIIPKIKASKHVDRFEPDSCLAIAAHQPDVLLRLGFRILKGPILEIPRYGIWSYHHGDNLVNKGGPPCFWEVMLGWPSTGSVLQILTDKLDDGQVLYRSWSQTNPLSVHRNANKVYWKSLYFVPRLLQRLQAGGQAELDQMLARAAVEGSTLTQLYRPPKNGQMLGLLLRFTWRNLLRKIKEQKRKYRWHFWIGPAESLVPNSQWQRIQPPQDRFFADPCLVDHEGKTYIFYEDFPFAQAKGHISVAEWDGQNLANGQIALEENFHLSFPQVWNEGKQWFMLPETKEARHIIRYSTDSFPIGWRKDKILLENVEAIDPVLVYKDGLYWLFFNQALEPGASAFDELYLYFCKDLEQGHWLAHPQNPIVSDVRKARMAGRVFQKDGQWYRPGQDCSVRYGYAFTLHRILEWNTSSYQEEPMTKVEPNWSPDLMGTHSLSRSEKYTVVDAYTW